MVEGSYVQPEMELLLLCIQQEQNEVTKERIRTLARGTIDWDALLELASWHTVAPLLYSNTESIRSFYPPAILAQLQEQFTANSLRNLFLTGELVKLVRRFDEAGIPVVAYKGPLLTTYYENSGSRQFEDLDLLIRKKDISAVDRMLATAGFHPCENRLTFARVFDFELTYQGEDSDVSIDLHWALMPGFFTFPFEGEAIWDRTVTTDLGGLRVRTLSSEDLLLFLCAHGTKHIWESLGWICDVARLVGAPAALDWNALYRRATEMRAARCLSLGLLLAGELLHAKLPDEILAGITRDRTVRRLAGSVYEQLFRDKSFYWGGRASSGFLVRSRDTLPDAIRCGAERVFRPTKAEWRFVRLPRALFSLYYGVRLLRLFGKHAGRSRSEA